MAGVAATVAVTLAGAVTIGGVVSCTVTVNKPVATLPVVSSAVHVTVVVPYGKVPPLRPYGDVQLGVTLSVALIEYVKDAETSPTTSMVWLPGMPTSDGGVESGPTVTVKLWLSVFGAGVLESVAVHVTVVVPSGNDPGFA